MTYLVAWREASNNGYIKRDSQTTFYKKNNGHLYKNGKQAIILGKEDLDEKICNDWKAYENLELLEETINEHINPQIRNRL